MQAMEWAAGQPWVPSNVGEKGADSLKGEMREAPNLQFLATATGVLSWKRAEDASLDRRVYSCGWSCRCNNRWIERCWFEVGACRGARANEPRSQGNFSLSVSNAPGEQQLPA